MNLAQIRSVAPAIFHTQTKKQQAKHVSPNTNRMPAAERAENAVFVPGAIDL